VGRGSPPLNRTSRSITGIVLEWVKLRFGSRGELLKARAQERVDLYARLISLFEEADRFYRECSFYRVARHYTPDESLIKASWDSAKVTKLSDAFATLKSLTSPGTAEPTDSKQNVDTRLEALSTKAKGLYDDFEAKKV
jgi:hypothetical protein